MPAKAKYIAVGLLLVAVAAMGYVAVTRINRAAAQEVKSMELPEFSFDRLDGTKLSRNTVSGEPLVILYYDPDCDHCQAELELSVELPAAVVFSTDRLG